MTIVRHVVKRREDYMMGIRGILCARHLHLLRPLGAPHLLPVPFFDGDDLRSWLWSCYVTC